MSNHLYYQFGDKNIPATVESLPSRKQYLKRLLDEDALDAPKPTERDIRVLWHTFAEIEGYVSPESFTLKEFARWILNDECEVLW